MPASVFITRHALVLSLIAMNPRVTAMVISSAIGITERAVRRIIADLYTGGYINKKKEGRGIRYLINTKLPLGHRHHGVSVGDFLESLGCETPAND